MIFGDKNLNTFGRCKVTKWSNSLYTDFERNTITYRGQVLAASEAPTIRTVKADVLVIAAGAFDLQQKLDSIAKWLYESGDSHLISTRDLQHYYKARCTAISVPTYEGPTATFSVTFTCSDDRLFTVHGDTACRSATQAMNNFTFNGKHCLNDMKCVFVLDKIDAVPKSNLTKYTISGVSGTLAYDNGQPPVLQEKTVEGTLYFVKTKDDMSLMLDSQIAERMHDITSWLINARRGQLIFDNDTTRYYEAEVAQKMQLSTDNWHNGYVKLKLTLQPVSTSVTSMSWTNSTKNVTSSYMSVAFPDSSRIVGYKTPLVITVEVGSSDTMTDLKIRTKKLDGSYNVFRLYSSKGFSLSNTVTLKIDSSKHTVTTKSRSSTSASQVDVTGWIYSGDFPFIYPNQPMSIDVAGTSAQVIIKVQCNRKWV